MTAWQCGGQGFESPQLHPDLTKGSTAVAVGPFVVLPTADGGPPASTVTNAERTPLLRPG
jgi:hypothetical protein